MWGLKWDYGRSYWKFLTNRTYITVLFRNDVSSYIYLGRSIPWWRQFLYLPCSQYSVMTSCLHYSGRDDRSTLPWSWYNSMTSGIHILVEVFLDDVISTNPCRSIPRWRQVYISWSKYFSMTWGLHTLVVVLSDDVRSTYPGRSIPGWSSPSPRHRACGPRGARSTCRPSPGYSSDDTVCKSFIIWMMLLFINKTQ